MNASGEPGGASSSTLALDLDVMNMSCESISFDSTVKVKLLPSSSRCDGGDQDSILDDPHDRNLKWSRTPWSKSHQRMLVAVFVVGFLFAVVVGAAYFLDTEHDDVAPYRPLIQTAPASVRSDTGNVTSTMH
ncbi:uncharacterized protein LOC142557997 [Dermacentor variabilis]|uniref:uncharacterized protein LOC142557997 n=1 Tax=Dermacentor variabilis TaxID=34621 RepID=UPI003F5BA76D